MTERSAAEQAIDDYIEAYNRFPNLPERLRMDWAKRVSSSPALRLVYSLTGPVLDGPFEPADYVNDGKRPHGMGVPW